MRTNGESDKLPKSELYPLFPLRNIRVEERAHLLCSDGHKVYYTVTKCSSQNRPRYVVFAHGGPGSRSARRHRGYFDKRIYRIVQLDQRGCGNSVPHGELKENSIPHLLDDMELLRIHLGVDAWHVFGGSWGAAIALGYAAAYPHRTSSVTIWSPFLGRTIDVEHWVGPGGAARQRPNEYAEFLSLASSTSPREILRSYRDQILEGSQMVATAAAVAWVRWERITMDLDPEAYGTHEQALHRARMAVHFLHDVPHYDSGPLTDLLCTIGPKIPVRIVHGSRDTACHPDAAVQINKAVPHSRLILLEGEEHWHPADGQQPLWDHTLTGIAKRLSGA